MIVNLIAGHMGHAGRNNAPNGLGTLEGCPSSIVRARVGSLNHSLRVLGLARLFATPSDSQDSGHTLRDVTEMTTINGFDATRCELVGNKII